MATYEDIKQANESIKTIDIKGKEYAEVNQRIKAFRMVYPEGFIKTNIESLQNGVCVIRAVVGFYDPTTPYLREVVLATGTAYEKENSTYINKTSYIENCETSAIGRALGMAGFGIDVSVASAEEVQNAMLNQPITQKDVVALKGRLEALNVDVAALLDNYELKSLEEMTLGIMMKVNSMLNVEEKKRAQKEGKGNDKK